MDFDRLKTKPWMRHAFRFGGGGGGPPTIGPLLPTGEGILGAGTALSNEMGKLDPVANSRKAAQEASDKADKDQAATQAAILKAQQDAAQAADDETLALARRQGLASTVLTTPQDRLAVATGTPRSLIGG